MNKEIEMLIEAKKEKNEEQIKILENGSLKNEIIAEANLIKYMSNSIKGLAESAEEDYSQTKKIEHRRDAINGYWKSALLKKMNLDLKGRII